MFQTTGMLLGLYKPLFWLAQVLPPPGGVTTPETAALVFSGPRFLLP